MSNSEVILNVILNKLKEQVENVDFSFAYPDKSLTCPLKDKFVGSVYVKLDNSVKDTESSSRTVYSIELLSPVTATSESIFTKAKEIADVLLNIETAQQKSSCNIGNIEYVISQRCYRTYIDYEIVCESGSTLATLLFGDDSVNVILLSEKVINTSCDIKVYGSSKPFDTILESNIYRLKTRVKNGEDLLGKKNFTLSYTSDDYTVKYSDCNINKCTSSIEGSEIIREYEITAYERVVVRNE